MSKLLKSRTVSNCFVCRAIREKDAAIRARFGGGVGGGGGGGGGVCVCFLSGELKD